MKALELRPEARFTLSKVDGAVLFSAMSGRLAIVTAQCCRIGIGQALLQAPSGSRCLGGSPPICRRNPVSSRR